LVVPRSIWNGTIMLGRIPVAVKVYSATEDHTVHFHQVHAADGQRLKQRRVCAKEGREVPYKEIVKGYERPNGRYVVLSQDEIAAAAGARAHVIELEQFVVTDEVDPVFFDRTYYLGARDKDARGPYRLLHDALAKAERAGLGRWVFRDREYLVAVRALDDVVALHTMRFVDELVDAKQLELPRAKRAPGKREVEMAGRLVDSLQARFDPGDFTDSYRERVAQLIEAKARGESPDIERERPRGSEDVDLMGALEASLTGAGG
jgi:DNA end-binding protein Ku